MSPAPSTKSQTDKIHRYHKHRCASRRTRCLVHNHTRLAGLTPSRSASPSCQLKTSPPKAEPRRGAVLVISYLQMEAAQFAAELEKSRGLTSDLESEYSDSDMTDLEDGVDRMEEGVRSLHL
ncbi:hypothetical protein MIND_00206000 [Mycena indigotica]|uniref:Uncharacterized protein n=1 Tax=Mycena indigotica TaxID=2126181 RepID=A0A8H6T4I5_9AGAR|nr:uncharacterized protein MIND_00206000 [Mycena indigotica]KAF7311945.1 hypothetical protein MIND_00206000 [Mycena indigotica]